MSTVAFRYFIAVADELNMTKAAAKLFISQQSLSAYIQRMEKQYGVTLFERKPSLQLTEAGRAMYFYAKEIVLSEDKLTSRFADITKNCRAHLTIGMSRQRSQIFFKNIWEKYHDQNPNISVTIVERNTDQLLSLLRSNKIDLCMGIDVAPSKDLEVISLFTERLCCSLSTDLLKRYHPATWHDDLAKFKKRGLYLTDICDLPFLLVPTHNKIRNSIDSFFSSHRIYPEIILETNNQELILSLAANGVGIISPMYLYELWQARPISLSFPNIFPIQTDTFSNTVNIVIRKGEHLPSYGMNMIISIQKQLGHYKNVINKMNSFHLVE